MKKFLTFISIILFFSCEIFSQVNRHNEPLQAPMKTRILFIFDASLSMHGQWQSNSKIVIANKIMNELLDSLSNVKDLELALRVFGHQKNFPPQDCDDSKLEIPFGSNNVDRIKNRLRAINPRGTTPIALSLERAIDDFPSCEKCRNIIILITDGIEECGGDPCETSDKLQKKGIVLRPFVIGIGRELGVNLDCIGTYYDGSTEIEFKSALNYVITQILNTTSCQVNLLDLNGNPTETNVNMTFFDSYSNKAIYNFIHTINSEGNPDTLFIDPIPSYYIKVHTIPPVFTDTFSLVAGKHKIVSAKTPQGQLEIKTPRTHISQPKYNVIIRKKDSMETLNVQMIETKENYLVGNYDLEILTLPRIIINNVIISQNKTTIIEIPTPGTVIFEYFTPGFGSLYLVKDNKMEWIYNLGGGRDNEALMLMPGDYKVVFRARHHNRSIHTIERNFTISSTQTTRIRLTNR